VVIFRPFQNGLKMTCATSETKGGINIILSCYTSSVPNMSRTRCTNELKAEQLETVTYRTKEIEGTGERINKYIDAPTWILVETVIQTFFCTLTHLYSGTPIII
jgi:hypothetical protein